MPRGVLLVLVGGWLALTSVASDRLQAAGPASPQVAASGASSSSSQARAVLDKYCVTCHNDVTLLGNLSLEQFDVAAAVHQAKTAEKIIRIVDGTLDHSKMEERKLTLAATPTDPKACVEMVCRLW